MSNPGIFTRTYIGTYLRKQPTVKTSFESFYAEIIMKHALLQYNHLKLVIRSEIGIIIYYQTLGSQKRDTHVSLRGIPRNYKFDSIMI